MALGPHDPAPRFETVTAPPAPIAINIDRRPDVAGILPPRAKDRLDALRQRAADAHSLIPSFESVRESSGAKTAAANRHRQLIAHPHEHGFGVHPGDPRALRAADAADEAERDAEKLQALYHQRVAAWREVSRILVAVEDWLKHGRPGGVRLEDHEEVPLPALKAGQTLASSLEAARKRTDECRHAVRRIEGAPWPSSHAKARVREEVRMLIQRGRPDVSALIKRNGDLAWPQMNLRSDVHNASLGAVAFTQTTDVLGVAAWAFEDALVKRLDEEIDVVADDDNALGETERAQRLSDAMARQLEAERHEVEVTWAMLDEKLPCEFRDDLSAVATLGLELVIARPTAPSPGTSRQHAFDVVGR